MSKEPQNDEVCLLVKHSKELLRTVMILRRYIT